MTQIIKDLVSAREKGLEALATAQETHSDKVVPVKLPTFAEKPKKLLSMAMIIMMCRYIQSNTGTCTVTSVQASRSWQFGCFFSVILFFFTREPITRTLASTSWHPFTRYSTRRTVNYLSESEEPILTKVELAGNSAFLLIDLLSLHCHGERLLRFLFSIHVLFFGFYLAYTCYLGV